jgi:hypothetical protein
MTKPPSFLGKLRMNDMFGELAVLIQDRPGVPPMRIRSAYCAAGICWLQRISYADIQDLRFCSPSINDAVQVMSTTFVYNMYYVCVPLAVDMYVFAHLCVVWHTHMYECWVPSLLASLQQAIDTVRIIRPTTSMQVPITRNGA